MPALFSISPRNMNLPLIARLLVMSALPFASASAVAEQFTYACRFTAINGQDVADIDRKFVVDFDGKTVDSFSAYITDAEIRWQDIDENQSLTIDRRTGRISASNSTGAYRSGDCAKPRKRLKPQAGGGSSNAAANAKRAELSTHDFALFTVTLSMQHAYASCRSACLAREHGFLTMEEFGSRLRQKIAARELYRSKNISLGNS